jgi:nucleoid DNA-binding protein
MKTHRWLIAGSLLGAAALTLGVCSKVQSQLPPPEETMTQRIARLGKVTDEEADRVLNVVGAAIQDELRRGREVTLTGLGTFRIVQIGEHKDLYQGRPITIPAVNAVEFIPSGGLSTVANSVGVKPAETVPPFQYTPLPNQTPGQKAPPRRAPNIRVR